MAVELDATPGASTANSFVTEEVATEYLTNQRLDATEWASATVDNRKRALIWASRLLDSAFIWPGAVSYLEQSLGWPRLGLVDAEGREIVYDTVPSKIIKATADLALELLRRNPLKLPELLGLGLRSASVGPLNVTLDNAAVLDQIPNFIVVDLEGWGELRGKVNKGGMRLLNVRRT
jgi:hypothetical protein